VEILNKLERLHHTLGFKCKEKKRKGKSGKHTIQQTMVLRSRVEQLVEGNLSDKRGGMTMKGERNKKKQARVNGMEIVDWFLAIDTCWT
jgi:hypothetical protein